MSIVSHATTKARRWGPGTAAVLRLLVASDGPMTGVAIAAAVGVTQPRVSQILKLLRGHAAVASTPEGYLGDPAALLDLYRSRTRPRLVGTERHWYSTRPLDDQVRHLQTVASDSEATIVVSADLAPDLIAPWRHPTVVVVYTDRQLPIAQAGLVPAEGRADASLILRWTDDTTLLSPSPPWRRTVEGVPIVDPCQQWWDLLDLGGEDRVEAAERLEAAILARALPRAP